MKIFISYKRRDEAVARKLHDRITTWGYQAWLDVEDIKPGEEWDTAIHKGLRDANIVIGLLTPESLASDNVLDEWAYALSTGKRLFLLWIREIQEANMPPRYIRLQRIDMRNDEESGFERLRVALASDAKIIPPNTTLAQPSAGQGGGFDAPPAHAAKPKADHRQNLSDSAIRRRVTNRDNMLNKVKNFWIDGVLEQSIHGVALIELGVEQDDNSVENPWETVLKHQSYGDYQLPTSANIADIFSELGNEMLILGNPGSGKTTTLLTLARDLIEEARKDDRLPIPVVFNLSSWADDRKPLAEWLVDELNTKYQVPRPTAKDWVAHDDLLLLLDGLDEVDGRYRDLCVLAINDFRSQHGFTSIAVCSRILDYEALSNRLRLNGAIALQPLDDTQIDKYLDSLGDQMSGVRDAMQHDDTLRHLAESPLMLSIMTLAFYGLERDELPTLDTVEAQRDRLFETYTRRMFERRPLTKTHKVKSWNPIVRLFGIGKYTKTDMLHYLRWLAARMVERKQSVFYIENLQPDWIATERSRTFFRFFGRMSFGMVSAVLISLIVIGAGISFITFETATTDAGVTSIYETTVSPSNTNIVSSVFSYTVLILSLILSIGAATLSANGMLDHALAKAPPDIRPLRGLGWYFVKMILIATGIGLLFSLIIGGLWALYIQLSFGEISNWEWEGIFVFSLLGIGSAALGGAVGALIAVIMQPYQREDLSSLSDEETLRVDQVDADQPRKHHDRYITLGYVMTVMIIGLIIGAVSVAVIYGFDLSYGVINGFNIDYKLNWEYVAPYIGFGMSPIIPTLMVALIIAYFGRRVKATTPYVILTTGVSTYVCTFLFFLVSWDVMRGWADWWQLGGVLLTLIISGLCAAVIGVLFSLIRETIEISEALRWQWSWRVALIATVICIVFSGITIYQPVNDLWASRFSSLTASEEATRLDEYKERSRIIAVNRETLTLLYDELNTMLETIRSSENAGDERNITFIMDPSWDDRPPTRLAEADAICEVDSTYTDNPNVIPYFWLWRTDLNSWDLTYLESPEVDEDRLENTFLNIALCEGLNFQMRDTNRDDVPFLREIIWQDLRLSLAFAVTISISCIIAAGVVGGIRRTEVVEVRTEPNSGIRQSRKTATRVVLILALVGLVIGFICGAVLHFISGLPTIYYSSVSYLDQWHEWIFTATVAVSVTVGAIIGLFIGGGDAVVKHVVLRVLLLWGGKIPFNYARLLDAAGERILLRKVGGGYIFIHRYLLEYFASQEQSSRKKPKDD
ncbi:MAG: TIR domain-containing protein [Chloroflexota bacterium]